MKNSITLTALFLLAATGLFAAAPATNAKAVAPAAAEMVSFSSLPSETGVNIKVDKANEGKAIVMVYDADGNVLYKDAIANYSMQKGYILNELEIGDYTLEVTYNKQVVKKQVHVYDESTRKMFFISQ